MDKQTLSNYGLLTVVTLILAVMLAFATPFGTYVGDGVVSVANGFVGASDEGLDEDNISNLEKQWDNKLNNNNGGSNDIPDSGAGGITPDEPDIPPIVDEPPTPTIRNDIIPDDATYTPKGGTAITGNGTNTFPDTVQTGDTYEYGDYIYKYNQYYSGGDSWESDKSQNGWGVRVKDASKTTYGEILSEIAGQPINTMHKTFKSCTSLATAPTIPSSVTNMQYTFEYCTSLTTAPAIPNSVTSMTFTFYSCTSLTTAPTIPSSVTNMGQTFEYCTSLTTAPTIPNGVTDMSNTFFSCTSLTTAPTIPNGVTDMSNTFALCTSLTTAPVIPNSVTNMECTFVNCTSLTTAPVIPNSVTNMVQTFKGCTSLTTAPTIPSSVKYISYAFYNCRSLTTAPTIPSSVTNMASTFSRCTALTGTIEVNANPTSYSDCLKFTRITGITGSCSQETKDALMATK